MRYVKEQVFKNDKSSEIRVVYLTLVPGKIPNINEYDKSFSKYTEMLSDAKSGEDGRILKYRSAVDSDKNKPDLVKFLDNCINIFAEKTDNIALLKKVYLEQYKTLLGHLGGNAAMLEYQKKLLEHIYSSQETLKAARDLVNIKQSNNTTLEYKTDILNEIASSPEKQKAANDLVQVFNLEKESAEINMRYINDCLRKVFIETDFKFEDNWAYRVWNKDNTVNLYVNGQWGLQIGFNTKGYFTEEEQLQYEKILADIFKIETHATEIEKGCDMSWVWLIIHPLADKKNMDEFLEYYTSFIFQVKEKFLAL